MLVEAYEDVGCQRLSRPRHSLCPLRLSKVWLKDLCSRSFHPISTVLCHPLLLLECMTFSPTRSSGSLEKRLLRWRNWSRMREIVVGGCKMMLVAGKLLFMRGFGGRRSDTCVLPFHCLEAADVRARIQNDVTIAVD